MVPQSSPPHQRTFLHHFRLLHCLLRRADAEGGDGEKEEGGEHDAAAAANREMVVVQAEPYLKQGWEGRADNELSSGD